MNKIIEVMGDPIVDIYRCINVDGSVTLYQAPGAAFNVLENLMAIKLANKEGPEIYTLFYKPSPLLGWRLFQQVDYPAKIYNWKLDFDKKILIDIVDSNIHSKDCSNVLFTDNKEAIKSLERWYESKDIFRTLVVSDYDKGFVTNNLSKLRKNYYDLCVVDSRYGNTDFKLLRYISKCLIYRRTGTDEIAHPDFDYRIDTFKSNPADLYYWQLNTLIPDLPMPHGLDVYKFKDIRTIKCEIDNIVKEPISTIGAGDTFTAAIAYFITNHPDVKTNTTIELSIVQQAIKYANDCCQSVIQNFFTSSPEKSVAEINI